MMNYDPASGTMACMTPIVATLRPFVPADAPACSTLIRACIETDTSNPYGLRDKMLLAESPDTVRERSRLFYLAVYVFDGEISGIAGLDMNEIRLLCVAPGYRRRGIGSALIDHLVAMVPGSLFRNIFVYAAPASVAFYTSNGFIEQGPVVFSHEEAAQQTVFMIREVPLQ
jgi:GNAT superfamily N-acetyltransferase